MAKNAVVVEGDTARRGEGAGLTFLKWATAVLCNGAGRYEEALAYANLAASICVQRMGAGPSMPSKAEVAAAAKAKRG